MKTNWIFIRGLARHSVHWGPFLETFQKTFPEAHIEQLDNSGTGNQAHIPSLLTISESVRDLRRRSKILHKGPVHLMTISLGSMMGIHWASQYPKEVTSLTVMNTSDPRNSRFWERLQPQNYVRILSALGRKPENDQLEELIFEMIAPTTPNREKWARIFAEQKAITPLNFARQLLAASSFRLPTQKPPMPVLILASRGDQLVNPVCSERIAKQWNEEVVWHPTAGHDIALEDPQWVCDQIKENLFSGS